MKTTMTTDTVTKQDRATTGPDRATADAPEAATPRLFGPRGRHRRPHPRKVLLAAGGLALVAGALSLVRLASEPGLGGGLGTGAVEAEPRLAAPGTDRATNAAATVGSVPKVSPSATSAMGGASATPTAGSTLVPPPSATTVLPAADTTPAAVATTIPEAPNTPAPATTPPAPATSSTAPQPAPTPTPSQTTSSPEPDRPGSVCLPVIGLCVDPPSR